MSAYPPAYSDQNQFGKQDANYSNTDTSQVQNYMVWSVLNIIFCCLCFGFVACYYSSQTNDMKMRGDLMGALSASRNAKNWNIVATVVGLILTINYGLVSAGVY